MNAIHTFSRLSLLWKRPTSAIPVLFAFTALSLTWLTVNLGIVGIGFLLGITVTIWPMVLAAIIAILVLRRGFGFNWNLIIAGTLIFILAMTASLYVSSLYIDIYADTQWYHSPATNMLLHGWNPVYAPAEPAPVPAESFPKGQWILNAQLQLLTDSARAGKATGPFFILIVFAAALIAILELLKNDVSKIKLFGGAAAAITLALHPVAISQIPAQYIDGQVAGILTLVLISSMAFAHQRSGRWFYIFILSVALAFSFKFNAAIFSVVLGSPALLPLVSRPQKFIAHWIALAASSLLIIIANWNPYVTNITLHGSPLYPVVAASTSDNESWALKRDYLDGVSNIEAVLIGHTSGTYQLRNNEPSLRTAWVPPWSESAFSNFSYPPPSARVIGIYGPFFGYLFFVSVFILIALAFTPLRLYSATGFLILLSLAIQSEGWHARYSPQGWALPILASIALLHIPLKTRLRNATQMLSVAFSGIMVVSAFIAIGGRSDALTESRAYTQRLLDLQSISGCLYSADLKMPRSGTLSRSSAIMHGFTMCENDISARMTTSQFLQKFSNEPIIILSDMNSTIEILNESSWTEFIANNPAWAQEDGSRSITLLNGTAAEPEVFLGAPYVCLSETNDTTAETSLQFVSAARNSSYPSFARVQQSQLRLGTYGTNMITFSRGRTFVLSLPLNSNVNTPRYIESYPTPEFERLSGYFGGGASTSFVSCDLNPSE